MLYAPLVALIEGFRIMGRPGALDAACEILRLCRPEVRR